jgi:hypothetical protein
VSGLERSKIEFEAAGKWAELIGAIKTACSSMNPLTIRLQESENEFIVERVQDGWVPKRLRLEFDDFTPKISWSCCNPHESTGEIHFKVFDESVFYVVAGRNRPLNEIVMVLCSCMTK